jgi:threonine/homoserine/homoserine lactone efflux protein
MKIYLPFLLVTFLLLIIPGPSVSIIIANTLRYNFISGIKTTLGTVTGSASIFILYAYGFDFLNNQLNLFLIIVQWIGIFYLFYIGFSMFKNAKDLNIKLPNVEKKNFYIQGFLVLWSNPKMIVFIGSFIPVFLDMNQDPFNQIITFGIIFCILGFISDGFYAVIVNFMKENFFKKDLSLIGKLSGTCLMIGSLWLLSLRF